MRSKHQKGSMFLIFALMSSRREHFHRICTSCRDDLAFDTVLRINGKEIPSRTIPEVK